MFAGALLILSGACRITFAEPVTCLSAKTAPAPAELNSTGGIIEVTLTNKCGKDITSYRIHFLDDSGKEVRGVAQELLDALVVPVPGDIFRANGSRVLQLDGSGASSLLLSASAAIFLDGSTAGDPDQVAQLVRLRTVALKDYRDELQALRSFSQWSASSDLRRKLDEAKQAKDPSARYLGLMVQQLQRSDAASWEAYVSRQVEWITRAVALFERSLGTSADPNK
jgi:hypothetical protein